MRFDERETGGIDRDILEWNIPEEVLAVLLKDRSTGRNLIWATDDYAERGDGFGAGDEMRIEQIVDKDNPVIRPRVDKSPDEQCQRVVKRAVQSVYGFDWQGDNVLLARENILATVVESFNADFFGEACSYSKWTTKSLLEFAEIISWNIWQMDGIKYVVPMSCKPKVTKETLLDGTVETHVEECPGCSKKGNRQHFGTYCKVMDWNRGEPVEFRTIAENGGGHGQ